MHGVLIPVLNFAPFGNLVIESFKVCSQVHAFVQVNLLQVRLKINFVFWKFNRSKAGLLELYSLKQKILYKHFFSHIVRIKVLFLKFNRSKTGGD